jgi:membrane associated rhomboid family serine protease
MTLSLTLIIIGMTALISIGGFSNQKVIDDLIFYPPAVTFRRQWYRFFSCGLIHADWAHLLFNMYALYLFGAGGRKDGVEYIFKEIFGSKGGLFYIIMYIAALAVCLVPTYLKHRENAQYRSLGASGAVSAVVFAYMMFDPMRGMGLLFLPVYIPGFLFGLIYLLVSSLLARKGHGNINHSAHIWGALFGVLFVIAACKLFSSYPVLEQFVSQIRNMTFDQLFQTR